jgi:hypothetical protein
VEKRFILILSFFIQAAIIFEAGAADPTTKGTGSTSATAGLEVTDSSNTSLLYIRNDGKVGINNTNPGSALDVKGTLRLSGATTGYVGIAPGGSSGHATYTLPSSDGTSGQVLKTDSSGTLSWVSPGNDMVVTHTSGTVAPVTKTVTYRTVTTDLSGISHVWITQNLGADAQSSAWNTTDGFSAGWYWQFNRKQGYKYDSPTVTPSWTINGITENSDWVVAQDPCNLLLGSTWRLPTYTEWSNVITNGGWSNYYDPYASCLRISSAGMIDPASGDMWGIDTDGMYWSSTQGSNTTGWYLDFYDWGPYCGMSNYDKALGNTVRCLLGESGLVFTHTTGDGVTPETKTVTYGTVVTSLSGSSKTWITKNLGADQQPTAPDDATEASAGWYWQFNRKQGYKHDGTTLTPSWTITSISENSNWVQAQDPCYLLLGTDWRLPTSTEWDNADTAGGWASQSDMYNSCLRLHSGGFLVNTTGALASRGADAGFNSSTQNTNTTSWNMDMWTQDIVSADKAYGVSVRCLK